MYKFKFNNSIKQFINLIKEKKSVKYFSSSLYNQFEVEDEEIQVTDEVEKIKREHKMKLESNI
jgi:hypothetical protein